LSSYHRKKYVWKLVYIHVLGYDVDFGHAEIVSLVSSNKFSEKQVGYVALSLLLRAGDAMLTMVTSSVRRDLTISGPSNSPEIDAAHGLALCCIANVSGLELIQTLHMEVQRLLISTDTSPCIKKKAALCLLRVVRTSPELVSGKEFAPQIATLLQERHLGILTSVMSLLIGLATQHEKPYEGLIPYVVHILGMLVLKKACAREYLYYRTPNPWLQIKLLRFLQLYPNAVSASGLGPEGNKQYSAQLLNIVSKILTETDVSDSINKSNADHAILFEAVNLIIIWGRNGPSHLREGAMRLLGKFISVREPNIRYLGLMTMSRLAQLEGGADSVKKYQATVLVSLKDADISVRRRALDLLFVMCDTDNAERIVDELITNLSVADAAIREEMVLKIAILAEKYATDLRWYVDTILKLIAIAGDFVSDSIWHRVVQIVTNHPQGDLQAYAAATLLEAVRPRRSHETAVRVAAYILGEFGFLIAERPGMSGEDQFQILHQHWTTVGSTTRAILITSYAKLANLYEECRPLVAPVLARNRNSVDIEIQQRSSEYAAMREAFSLEAVEDLLREMPPFEDKRQSTLEKRLEEKDSQEVGSTGDEKVWTTAREDDTSANRLAESNGQTQTQTSDISTGLQAVDEEQESENDDQGEQEEQERTNDQLPSANAPEPDTVIGIPKEVIPAMRKAFSNLCTSLSGVLFENQLLQVGLKHEYNGCQGKVQVFFGNLSSTPLVNFKCDVDQPSHLKLQMQGTPGLLENGCSVPCRSQAKVLLLVEVKAPFDDAPAMRITFEIEGERQRHVYPLRLPIVATCFMEPLVLEAGAFMQRWKSLEGQERECQEVVKAPPNSTPIDEESMQRISRIITDGLKFGRCQGCDPTPWTVSGAATFRTGAKDANGHNINVGCLVRVEANPKTGAYRVTTRTLHPICSRAVKNVAIVSIKLA
jgi:AP-2 complex subunit alpha